MRHLDLRLDAPAALLISSPKLPHFGRLAVRVIRAAFSHVLPEHGQLTKEGCMRRFAITPFGAAIVASLALAVPPASAEGCATTCAVGGAGTGGQNSDGKAGGFRLEGPSTGFPGSTFTNQGNEMAGRRSVPRRLAHCSTRAGSRRRASWSATTPAT